MIHHSFFVRKNLNTSDLDINQLGSEIKRPCRQHRGREISVKHSKRNILDAFSWWSSIKSADLCCDAGRPPCGIEVPEVDYIALHVISRGERPNTKFTVNSRNGPWHSGAQKKRDAEKRTLPRRAQRIGGTQYRWACSSGKPPLDVTIETRLNLIMVVDRVILSVKIAASDSRHLRQDPGHVYSKGSRRRGRDESKWCGSSERNNKALSSKYTR